MNRYTIISPLLVLAIWTLASELQLIDTFLLPHPKDVGNGLLELVTKQHIVSDTNATLIRTVASIGLSTLFGIPIGIWLGQSQKFYKSAELVINFFRSTPAAALFPLFLLLFGIGDTSKIAVAVFSSILIIIFNTAHGVMNASQSRMLAAKLIGATGYQRLRHILFWESLPQTFIGLKQAVSLSLVLIVVTEMFIGTTQGLGHRIIDAQISYQIPEMYAVILATGLLGYLLNLALNLIEKHYVHWVRV